MSVNINNKNKKLRNYSHLLCMVLFTLFMCIVYSKRVSVSNDHYASLETYYDFFEYGGDFANLGSRFNIGTILNTFFIIYLEIDLLRRFLCPYFPCRCVCL